MTYYLRHFIPNIFSMWCHVIQLNDISSNGISSTFLFCSVISFTRLCAVKWRMIGWHFCLLSSLFLFSKISSSDKYNLKFILLTCQLFCHPLTFQATTETTWCPLDLSVRNLATAIPEFIRLEIFVGILFLETLMTYIMDRLGLEPNLCLSLGKYLFKNFFILTFLT